jgi:CubicO group peptidase (beta-lactamase class C family)
MRTRARCLTGPAFVTLPRVVAGLGLLLLLLDSGPFAHAQEAPLQGFDDYVQQALADWSVPGLAMAIVKDDAVVFTKGYGVRTLGDPTPVTASTVFGIGSATKAFTAASLAMLVDAGKLQWDDPATKYLPGLQLYDPYVTRELTVRDLLTHRSGLAPEPTDLLIASGYDRDEILRRLRYLKPRWSFRSRFGYQNIMYLAAGQIIPAVTGQSWDDFVRERIFTPLGMTASHTSVTALPSDGDVATPHAWIDGKAQPLPWPNLDNIGPAGSITSNVLDMAQWVRLQLGAGTYQQAQLFSAAVAKEMQMPQTIIRSEPSWSWFLLYGLGWFLHDYQGRKVVEHAGGTMGIRALVALLPAEKLGLVILTNLGNPQLLPEALRFRVFDAYLGRPPRDWSREFLQEAKGRLEQAEAERKKQEAARVEGTAPSLALEWYAGTYQHDVYGKVTVTAENGQLVLQYGLDMADLKHWHYDTFQLIVRAPVAEKSLVTFALNAQGRVEEMKVSDLVFKRDPE